MVDEIGVEDKFNTDASQTEELLEAEMLVAIVGCPIVMDKVPLQPLPSVAVIKYVSAIADNEFPVTVPPDELKV